MINDPRIAATPSQADRVGRRDNDAGPRQALADEPLTRLVAQLQRYAGWLAKDHVSVAVRADVQAFGVALDLGHDTSPLLLTLDKDLERLPSGDVRKMLRNTLRDIRAVLGPSLIAAHDGEGS